MTINVGTRVRHPSGTEGTVVTAYESPQERGFQYIVRWDRMVLYYEKWFFHTVEKDVEVVNGIEKE